VMIYEVLDAWGQAGLETHVKKMQTEYKKRAAIVQEAAGKLCLALLSHQQCMSWSALLSNTKVLLQCSNKDVLRMLRSLVWAEHFIVSFSTF